jgi:hypothetical protein
MAGSALIAWTSLEEWSFPRVKGPQNDYYNLLVAGFRKGSLALDVKVPDRLKNAENPWDPSKRPPDVGMHDISYNDGHYYLYFGVVPAVVLFWPFRFLTGNDLPFVYSSILFALGSLLVAAWLWLRIVRDNFPRAGLGTKLGGLAAITLAGGQLVLARRTAIWEMPIAAGHYYVICMVASGYVALRSKRPWGWLAVSGTCLGLAFGSRPTLAAAGAGLATLVLAVGWQGFPQGRWRSMARRSALAAFSAGVPLAAIIACLFAYNQARFGNPLEFGLNYQLNSNYERVARHFSLSFIRYNFPLYFLKAPQWGRYFPFIHPVTFPLSRPAGYYGYEYVYGALIVCPILWWTTCLAGCARRVARNPVLAAFSAMIAATALATSAFLLCFNTAAARYTVDFLPWWVWLGALGWAVVEDRVSGDAGAPRVGRRLLRPLFAMTAAASCILAYCESAELHDLFHYWNPSGYRWVARVFDAPVALAEAAAGARSGPIEMDVTFPRNPIGSYDPLVVTGVEYQKDYVFVYYQSATIVRLGYVSDGDVLVTSRDIPVVPGRTYRIRVECGSLYPPDGVLYFRGYGGNETESLKGWVRIEVDGVPVLTARKPWNEATPGSLQIGRDDSGTGFGSRFAGTITGVHRGAWSPPAGDFFPKGDVEMKLAVPDAGLAGKEPLLSVGHTGKADILGIRMPDQEHLSLLYESWGIGQWESAPFALPITRITSLRIRFGPLLRVDAASPMSVLSRSLVVWADGKPIWWLRTRYPLDPAPKISQMYNGFGSSALIPMFQGRLESVVCDAPPPGWKNGPFSAVEADLAGRGEGREPLVVTGIPHETDTLAIEWLPRSRARLLYQHASGRRMESQPFDWPENSIHVLRAGMPSLRALDATPDMGGHEGVLRADVDGAKVWEQSVPYFLAPSSSVSVGKNAGNVPGIEAELGSVVAGLRQVPE